MNRFLLITCIYLILVLYLISAKENIYIRPKDRPAIVSKLKKLLAVHKAHIIPEPKDTDLYCKCNEQGCDTEMIHILGPEYAGFCRIPGGGVCRTVEGYNENGELYDVHLECISGDLLFPLNRPFQCHTDEDHPRIRQKCCSNESLCNDMEIGKLAPKIIKTDSKAINYVAVIFMLLAIIGLIVFLLIMYYLGSTRLKNVFRRILSRVPYISTLTFATTNINRRNVTNIKDEDDADKIELDKLCKPEPIESNESSGYGLASLSKRTIARQITLVKSVAVGRFGEVHLGNWRGEKVAVKIFNTRDEKSWWRETDVYTTNTLRHNNILRWIASDNKDVGAYTQLWLVTEWMELGSLYDYLEENVLDKKIGLQMMKGISHGLAYLHTEVPGVQNQCYKPPIAHRDLKSKNILVKNDLTCVIADLGLAVRNIHGKMEDIEDKRVGTVRYLAPELLGDIIPNKFVNFTQADVYAISLIFWEICRRINYKSSDSGSYAYQLPYYEHIDRDPSPEEMAVVVVAERKRPTIDPDWQADSMISEMTRIMQESWTENATSRLTALNIRNNIDRLANKEGFELLS